MTGTEQFRKLTKQIQAASSLKLLDRMMQSGHSPFPSHPLRHFGSGQDERSGMHLEWLLREYWIRCLHLPAFISQEEDGTFVKSFNLSGVSEYRRWLLERELQIIMTGIPGEFFQLKQVQAKILGPL